jgi:hypothetical protein
MQQCNKKFNKIKILKLIIGVVSLLIREKKIEI